MFTIFLDKAGKKYFESIEKLKLSNLMLTEDKEITKYMIDKKTIKNAITFYSVAKTHKLFGVAGTAIKIIESCFSMLIETENFSQLDFDCVLKVISSSKLNIHSEVEIFDAVNTWLKHNSEERIKYAVQLLLKVRLTLLSEHALKYIKNCNASFIGVREFKNLINEVLCGKQLLLQSNPSNSLRRRCCTQTKFKLLICGGYDFRTNKIVRNTKQVDGNNFNNIKILSLMSTNRKCLKAICLKGEVYVFGGRNNTSKLVRTVEKYSPSTNKWKKIAQMFDNRQNVCACAFMDKIFMFGGAFQGRSILNYYYKKTNSCLQFDTKQQSWSNKSWKEVSVMNEARINAGCSVFRGSIVVSGGINQRGELNTVESYDVFADKWSTMPNMVNA